MRTDTREEKEGKDDRRTETYIESRIEEQAGTEGNDEAPKIDTMNKQQNKKRTGDKQTEMIDNKRRKHIEAHQQQN